jgi:hypothetical protein
MLKERNAKLVQNLQEIIKKYSRNEKLRSTIMDEFKSRNMKASNAVNILNERLELSTLDIDDSKDLILLFVFAIGMFKALSSLKQENEESIVIDLDEIDPKNYFTPIEIENLTDYKFSIELDENTNDILVFPNMLKVADGHFKGIDNCVHLYRLHQSNEVVYNFKTQRDPVIDIYGMKRIRLDKNKVQAIRERLKSGQQYSDEIRLNLLHNGEDEYIYNEKTRELRIISGTLNIFDGYHRVIANSLFVSDILGDDPNAEIPFNWGLAITNFSEKKAQDFMVQIDKQKPMKQEHIKAMDTASLGNLVVNSILDIDTSEFAGQIRELDTELKYSGMTTKTVLSTSIEETYKDKLQNKLLIRKIAKHITNVIDYILALHVDEFIANPEETKQVSYINHKNMFAGYVALSAELYEDKDWEEKVEKVIDNIDFSVNNTFWNDIKVTDTEMSKPTRSKLYKFFKNQL